jgi:hypothetical protein
MTGGHAIPDPVRFADNHLLIVIGPDDGGQTYHVACPFGATPEKRRKTCGYWETCPCDALFRAERARQEALGFDLDHADWIGGCSAGKDGPVIEAHEDCPHTGEPHHQWEGEIVSAGTRCGVEGEFAELGRELIEHLLPLGPGRWPIGYHFMGEDGVELSLLV